MKASAKAPIKKKFSAAQAKLLMSHLKAQPKTYLKNAPATQTSAFPPASPMNPTPAPSDDEELGED